MSDSKKVFVVNFNGHDLTEASKYGQLVYLTTGSINIFATDRLVYHLINALKEIEEEDFLLLSGNIVANILAFCIILTKHKKVNVLIYNFKNKGYVLRTITQEQFEKGGIA